MIVPSNTARHLKMTGREKAILDAIIALTSAEPCFSGDDLINMLYPSGAFRPAHYRQSVFTTMRNMQYKAERAGIWIERASKLGRGNVANYRVLKGIDAIVICARAKKWSIVRRSTMCDAAHDSAA